jgi:putative nuclease
MTDTMDECEPRIVHGWRVKIMLDSRQQTENPKSQKAVRPSSDGHGSINSYDPGFIGGHVDIERTMQFILEQQAQISAQFSAHQAQFLAHQAQISEQFAAYQARFDNAIVQINAVLLDVVTTQERTNAILATLAERQIATEEAMGRLVERQNITEQSLNALMATVERHIANHR